MLPYLWLLQRPSWLAMSSDFSIPLTKDKHDYEQEPKLARYILHNSKEREKKTWELLDIHNKSIAVPDLPTIMCTKLGGRRYAETT